MEESNYINSKIDRAVQESERLYNSTNDNGDWILLSVKKTLLIFNKILIAVPNEIISLQSYGFFEGYLNNIDNSIDSYLESKGETTKTNLINAEKPLKELITKLYPFADFANNANHLQNYYNSTIEYGEALARIFTETAEKQAVFNEHYEQFVQKSPDLLVDGYKNIFHIEEKKLNRQAYTWLLISVLILGFGFYFGMNILTDVVEKTEKVVLNNNQLFALTTAKIFIFSLIYLTIHTCTKNYKVAKHNALTYKQRAKSLETYRLFYESANSEDVKNMILLQTTNTIFNHQNTGYFSAGENDASSMDFITKLMSTITPKNK